MNRNFVGWVALFLLGLLAAGCNEHPDQKAKDAPRVTVSLPLKRQITAYDYYTGRISAKETLDIRARVNGYLDKVFFKDGDEEVPAGAKLFEIDRRPFQADVDRLTGELNRAKATNQTAKSEMERQKLLLERSATSRSDYDIFVGKLGEAVANVETATGALEQAKINLGYTIVTSRIAGRISKTNITPGNLVVADKTLLTTVVTVDPMYADFDVDETTVTKIKRMILAGKFKSANKERVPVDMALGSEQDFANEGFINFVDNKVDPGTGQLRVRGEFPNKDRVLMPGNFCRIRLALGAPHDALLVPERAILSEQGSKYVLIVDKDNIVQQQPVDVGPLVDGLRVIDGGLRGSEKVIINGLQRVRPSVTVDPRDGKIEPQRGRTGNGKPADDDNQ